MPTDAVRLWRNHEESMGIRMPSYRASTYDIFLGYINMAIYVGNGGIRRYAQ